ncbi:MAG: hypothetical protein ABJE66_02020 [Deltaproteobacteria bacterium]
MDSTVRSIQVASALLERVAVLMKAGAASGPQAVAELELRIGEAQQTMPEVWNHLGDARNAIAAAGKDVGEFDQLRGNLRSQLASTDIDGATRLGWNGRTETIKTVTWDVEGLKRAIAARDVLRRLRSDIDWVALERQQNAELAAAGSLTGARWTGLAKIAGLLAAALAAVYAIKAFMN